MRVFLRVLAVLLVLVIAGAVGGYLYARPLIKTGTGYAAHNTCAVSLVADRPDPDADLPSNPLVPYLTGYVNQGAKSSTSSLLWVLSTQKAWYTKGFGCTLGPERPTLEQPTLVEADLNPLSSAPSPRQAPELTTILGKAFGDDLPQDEKSTLGTRGIVVIRGGQIVAERYADGFDAETPQLGWSMTKSVANLMVGRLVQEKRLDIKDSALRPEWTDDRQNITVDELMRMTSGLNWDETYDLGTPITEMLYTHGDMAEFAASQPLEHAPGTHQKYSSGSTNILCSVLTRLADVPDADLPRQKIFKPLGLSSAVMEPDMVGTPVCSSYMWATPRDWAAVGQFALQDGVVAGDRLLPKGWMKQSTTVEPVQSTEEDGYAAGWWVNREADGRFVDATLPKDAYWASGHDGQRVVIVPSADLVVVRLGFSPEIDGDQLRTSELVADLVKLSAKE